MSSSEAEPEATSHASDVINSSDEDDGNSNGDQDLDADKLESLMADKASEIFRLCDREGKGLLTKNDMRHLAAELPLSADQLEDVFDSLDVAKNGFLTSVEFANGFGRFLGLPVSSNACGHSLAAACGTRSSGTSNIDIFESADDRRVRYNSIDGVVDDDETFEDDEGFEDFMKNLGACGLLDDVTAIKSLWLRLRSDDTQPVLLENFEDLLRRITTELSRMHMDYTDLKSNYRNKNCAFDEEINNLYEEMEEQLNAEKQRIHLEEKLRERKMKEEMEKELEERDRRLNDLLQREREMQLAIIELNAKEIRITQENAELLKEKEEIEEKLINLKSSSAVTDDHRFQSLDQADLEMRTLASVQISEWLELERTNLMRQLSLLRETNRQLADINDERLAATVAASATRRLPPTPTTTAAASARLSISPADSIQDVEANGVLERQQPIGAYDTTDNNDNSLLKPTGRSVFSERLFKIVFVGDSGVGKSSFIHRFCSQTFKPSFSATIGVDFQVKNIEVDGHLVSLQLWDTAGQERFRTFTRQYFRKADGILVMYDVTDLQTFTNVRDWMNNIQENADDSTVIMLLGNKVDLLDEDQDLCMVEFEHGEALAKEYGALFFETSAKTGFCVLDSIEEMTRCLRDREDSDILLSLQEQTTTLTSEDIKQPRMLCCS